MHRINTDKSRKKLLLEWTWTCSAFLLSVIGLVACVSMLIPNLVLVQEIEVKKIIYKVFLI